MYEDGPNFRQSGDERRSRRIPLVVEIWDVVVREVVVSSTLVVAGVLTVVTLVVISVVVNSGSSEYFARYFGSKERQGLRRCLPPAILNKRSRSDFGVMQERKNTVGLTFSASQNGYFQ